MRSKITGRIDPKRGEWHLILNLPKDEVTGKYPTKQICTGLPIKGNKRKAEQLLQAAIKDYESQMLNAEAETQNMAMSELFKDWLETVKGTIRGNSYINYASTAAVHVIPYFEALRVPVQEIKPVHIQKYYNTKYAEGLSASTIEKHRSVLRGAFMYARDILEIIDTIPSDRAKLPKKESLTPSYYTEKEIGKLFEVVKGETVESAVRLCATYGFRRSEVLGLKWDSIDFQRKTISVRQTIIREGSKSIEKATVKKQASYRTVPLIPIMEAYLKELRREQLKDKKLCGNGYHDSDYICRRVDGSLLEPNNVTFRFRTLIRQAMQDGRLNKYIKFHDLRHSAASVLINNGCPIDKLQAWLGHSDIKSTKRYAHLEYRALVEAGDILNGVYEKMDEQPADTV